MCQLPFLPFSWAMVAVHLRRVFIRAVIGNQDRQIASSWSTNFLTNWRQFMYCSRCQLPAQRKQFGRRYQELVAYKLYVANKISRIMQHAVGWGTKGGVRYPSDERAILPSSRLLTIKWMPTKKCFCFTNIICFSHSMIHIKHLCDRNVCFQAHMLYFSMSQKWIFYSIFTAAVYSIFV